MLDESALHLAHGASLRGIVENCYGQALAVKAAHAHREADGPYTGGRRAPPPWLFPVASMLKGIRAALMRADLEATAARRQPHRLSRRTARVA